MRLLVIRSLRQRLMFFLLIPVAILLSLMAIFGFVCARKIMLNQWQETAIAKLRWAAHDIDMRLGRPIEWIEMFHKTGGQGTEQVLQSWILDQLRETEGVTAVRLEWLGQAPERTMMSGMGSHMGHDRMMRFHHARIAEVTPPRYDTEAGQDTVSLVSILKDETEKVVGRLEVMVRFSYLMEDVTQIGWWQSDAACLVDESGTCLVEAEPVMGERDRLGKTNDPFEMAVLEAMKEKPYGTLLGPGHPATRVAGFYRLEEAPWTILLFASGRKVLAPIVRFRFYYALGGGISVLLIILLIQFVGGKIVDSVKEVSRAAKDVAQGNYGDPLTPKSRDEIGQLTESFNAMVQGLKERDFISNTFGRYVDQEIAKELMRRPEASRLGGDKREVAVLFSDIRGFTALSESLSPEAIISMVNRYFFLAPWAKMALTLGRVEESHRALVGAGFKPARIARSIVRYCLGQAWTGNLQARLGNLPLRPDSRQPCLFQHAPWSRFLRMIAIARFGTRTNGRVEKAPLSSSRVERSRRRSAAWRSHGSQSYDAAMRSPRRRMSECGHASPRDDGGCRSWTFSTLPCAGMTHPGALLPRGNSSLPERRSFRSVGSYVSDSGDVWPDGHL